MNESKAYSTHLELIELTIAIFGFMIKYTLKSNLLKTDE